MFAVGVCLHHEAGAVGAAVPERVWERRLEILREMGCNAIRTSHNPYAAEFMDLCDRMGFLVMNEAFDEWKVGKGQIGPYWNWKGREGQAIPVTCYTNCDTVELFLNGKSVGLKGYAFPRFGMEGRYANYPARSRVPRTTNDLHLEWDVPYEPGTLKAVGTKDGKIASTAEVSTTGEPAAVRLMVDRAEISADRRDVAHITAQIVDGQGRIAPAADHEIAFVVEGEGRLIGLDNGDPQSHENYKATHRKAFHGLCLAIVESTAKSGRIRVTANSPGLQPGNLTISTRT